MTTIFLEHKEYFKLYSHLYLLYHPNCGSIDFQKIVDFGYIFKISFSEKINVKVTLFKISFNLMESGVEISYSPSF